MERLEMTLAGNLIAVYENSELQNKRQQQSRPYGIYM